MSHRRNALRLKRTIDELGEQSQEFVAASELILADVPWGGEFMANLRGVIGGQAEFMRYTAAAFVECAGRYDRALIRSNVLARRGEPRARFRFEVDQDTSPVVVAFAAYLTRLRWRKGLSNELVEMAIVQFAGEFVGKLHGDLIKALVKFQRPKT